MISTTTPNFSRYLVTLPDFALYFLCAMILLGAFLAIYTRITPQHEWRLIRDGNTAAAVSLGGALLGFVLPLGSAIMNSLSLMDMLVWGVVALAIQLLAFGIARALLTRLPERISQGEMAAGITAAAFSLSIGVLNAACMTY